MSDNNQQDVGEINAACLKEALKVARNLSDENLASYHYNDKRTIAMAAVIGDIAFGVYKDCAVHRR